MEQLAVVVVLNLAPRIDHNSTCVAWLPMHAAFPYSFGFYKTPIKVWTNREGKVRPVYSVVRRVMSITIKQDGEPKCKVRLIPAIYAFSINTWGALDTSPRGESNGYR